MRQVEAVAHARSRPVGEPGAIGATPSGVLGAARAVDTHGAAAPLVLHIDDLHWADADSLLVLEALLRPPDPPPLLMVACLRTEEIAAKPFLQALLQAADRRFGTTVSLEPMTEDETREVVASLIPAEHANRRGGTARAAREAGGNPFLLEQLAHYVAGTTRAAIGRRRWPTCCSTACRARRMVRGGSSRCWRCAADRCRRRPVYEAAGLAGDERPLVAILRSDHLLRHSGSASRIELYHERLRETLAAQLSPEGHAAFTVSSCER